MVALRALFLHTFCDELFGGEVHHVPRELDFVGRDNLSAVDDPDIHALIVEVLDEGHCVALGLALLDVNRRLGEAALGYREILAEDPAFVNNAAYGKPR